MGGLSDLDLLYGDPSSWTEAALDSARAVLSPDERARASRFRFDRDHRLYVAAHSMLRRALAQRLHVAPDALVFDQNAYGRPELGGAHARALRFSISHSHGMALCAITDSRDIGVDVEPIDRELPMSVAERCFDDFELRDVLALPEPERAARFFAYWTLKEAYVKARGIGLSLNVRRVAFSLSQDAVQFRPDSAIEPAPSEWRFESLRLAETHQAAIALRGNEPFRVRPIHVRGAGPVLGEPGSPE